MTGLLALCPVWWRQARGQGGLGLLLAALILAVLATTLLTQTIGQIQVATRQQAGQLLGGDLLVNGSQPLPPMLAQTARQLGLRQTPVISFSSMLQTGEGENSRFQLVNVKAVTSGYPLRGRLTVTNAAQTLPTGSLPRQGQIWLEPALFDTLQIRPRQLIQLGDARLQVSGRIERDPNREIGFSGFSPAVIISLQDLPRLNINGAGSRMDYRLLLAGPPEQVQRFQQQFKPFQPANNAPAGVDSGRSQNQNESAAPVQYAADARTLPQGVRIRDAEQGNRRLLTPLKRLDDFAQLANLITLLLCGLAIAYTASRLARQLTGNLALLRSLGASRQQLLSALLVNLAALWLLAVILGAVLGGLMSWGILGLVRQLLPALELDFSMAVLVRQSLPAGLWTAALTLLAFSLPALLQLLNTAPIRILRQDENGQQTASIRQRLSYLLIPAALLLLLLVVLGVPWLQAALALLAASVVALLAWAVLAGLLRILGQYRQRRASLDSGSLLRMPARASVQLWSLALGLSLMASLWLVRYDLLQRWQTELPQGTANQFVYGLPPDQKEAFAQAISQRQWASSGLYPMIKARMGTLNGQPFSAETRRDSLFQRELNLSVADQLPANNRIVSGKPFDAPFQLSVEAEVASRLGLKLGDRLTVNLPEGPLTATVVNTRTVVWDSFSPNFFFMYSPGTLDANAGSYLGSFHVPVTQRSQIGQLVSEFPATLFIDIQAILDEVRRMLQTIGQALGLLGGLSAAAGILVLLATLDASLDQKRREAAILRTLGMSQRALRARLLRELAVLGAVAGLLAAGLAELLVNLLAKRLELDYQLHPQLLLLPVGLASLAMLIGWLRLRPIWQVPARQILRGN